jgi:hypothetical protein
MEMAMTKRMYRVFDTLYHRKSEALEALVGWEHKEWITEYHVVGFPSIIKENIVNAAEVQLFKNFEDAISELEEMNK